jgi:3-hydroxyisobutyrate dehydrogenase-like beta-hydroxyacid dehydrogenase
MQPPGREIATDAAGPSTDRGVGLIGLGLVGSALAGRFLASGLPVLGFDVRPERAEALRQLGGDPAPNVEALASCPRIVLSLPDSEKVREVLDALEHLLRPGRIVIDTTTGEPDRAAEAGRRLEALGVSYLDATISGSSEQVRSAEATVIAGGPAAAFESCRDLFRLFAREAYRVGPCGSGSRMKLVSNLILGLNRAALAEGLTLAGSWGLDLRQALAVLRESAAYSRVMDTKGDKMISADFAPQARLSQHHKDVRLILGAAARSGVSLPLSRTHDRLLDLAEAAGLGDLDNSAILRVYEQLAGPGPEDPSAREG